MIDDLIKSIEKNEGFVNMVYKDSLGFDTIGFGTKLPLTREECEVLLKHRLNKKISELQDAKPFIVELPDEVQNVLYEMAYQMGTDGLLKFHKTWEYLQDWDFEKASVEMLDSKWARIDAPNRAKNLSEIIRKVNQTT